MNGPNDELNHVFKPVTLLALLGSLMMPGVAKAEDVSLPGGAATLNETHGDWTVACAVRTDPQNARTKSCTLLQEQMRTQGQARQRVLHIELRPDGDRIKGTLILPFGLDLARGATFQLDEGPAGPSQPFRTCLPVGCLIDIDFDGATVKALKAGKSLKINASATDDSGQEMALPISLEGFSGAYDRVVVLME